MLAAACPKKVKDKTEYIRVELVELAEDSQRKATSAGTLEKA